MTEIRIFDMADDRENDVVGEAQDGLLWAQIESGARVVWSSEDEPMRVLAPRSRRRVGKYNSVKAGRLLAHESRGSGYVGGEKLALMLCEIDPSVVDMRTQHLRFDLMIEGGLHSYVPDIVRLMDDGSLEVIEVKKDDSWKSDLFYVEKIRLATAVCTEVGVTFAVWTDRTMAPSRCARENIVAIQTARTAEFDEVDRLHVVRALTSRDGTATLRELKAALSTHTPHEAEAIIRAMMCRRLLSLPLDERHDDETVATQVQARDWTPTRLAA